MGQKKQTIELDRLDISLLNLVQENNQLSAEELGTRVGLSSTACSRRLKRLRSEGAISADVAIVSPEAISSQVTLIVLVSLEREQLDLLDSFKRRISNYPEVTQCYYVTGNADFVLLVRVPSMEAYCEFTERAFFGDKNVKTFLTYTAMQTIKFTTKFDLQL